jgi:hypothetical protein
MKNLVYGIVLPAILVLGTASSRGQLTPLVLHTVLRIFTLLGQPLQTAFADFCAPSPLHGFYTPAPHPLSSTSHNFRGFLSSCSTPSVLHTVSADF